MKTIMRMALVILFITFPNITWSDTGVFYGSGNQVIPIKNDKIQMVRERVEIKLSIEKDNGRFGVPFIPWANVTAKFYFRNTTKDEVSLQIGFPFLDLQGFGDEKYVLDNLNFEVISGNKEMKTELKEGLIEKDLDPNGLFKKVFAWDDQFKPFEEKEVIVTYKMLMGVAAANSIMRDFDEQGYKFTELDNIFPALSYSFSYITKTAYTWNGSIDEAVFLLDCSEVYSELEKADFFEGMQSKEAGYERPIFWESIHPDSAKKHDGIYEWVFRGAVPEDGLFCNFIVLFLPSQPADLRNYYFSHTKKLTDATVSEFKSVLKGYYQYLAYNQEPQDLFAKSYFSDMRLIKMPRKYIFEQDKKGIDKIADEFDKLIKK